MVNCFSIDFLCSLKNSVLTLRIGHLLTRSPAMPKVCSIRVLGLLLTSLIVCVCFPGEDTILPVQTYCRREYSGAGDIDAMSQWRQRGAAAAVEGFRQVGPCTA